MATISAQASVIKAAAAELVVVSRVEESEPEVLNAVPEAPPTIIGSLVVTSGVSAGLNRIARRKLYQNEVAA